MYKITGIFHNGRQGARWESVTDSKYEDLVGCTIGWDVNAVKQFEPTKFLLKNHPLYSFWNTSQVLQLSKEGNRHILETVNTIYLLEDLSDADKERESDQDDSTHENSLRHEQH
jgi:hypothetical protein